jgi:hypothetical protein
LLFIKTFVTKDAERLTEAYVCGKVMFFALEKLTGIIAAEPVF